MVVEGTTLAAAIAAYFYLRGNFSDYPPPRDPMPEIVLPTVGVAVALASLVLAALLDRAAHRKDASAIRLLLVATVIVDVAFVALRVGELDAIGLRWDANAYASAAWLVMGLHGTLLVVNLFEDAAFAVLFFAGPIEEKHYYDVTEASFYWYFLVGSWVVCWLTVYVSPRLL
jgi:heme/copper-type cytochrome/quinol oxidase subunit 3